MSGIHEVGGDLHNALEDVSVPTYLVDRTGIIRWINPAAERLFGNVVGRLNTSVVAPEETRRTRESFARKLAGTEKVTDAAVVLIDASGNRVQVEISAVALDRRQSLRRCLRPALGRRRGGGGRRRRRTSRRGRSRCCDCCSAVRRLSRWRRSST